MGYIFRKNTSLRLLTAVLVVLLAVCALPFDKGADADSGVTVFLDGRQLYFDVQPQIIDNLTMVPMRNIFENLGMSVIWNDSDRTVTATKSTLTIRLQVGSRNMLVGSNTVVMDAAPVVVSGRTMVPVAAIASATGATVTWDGSSRRVNITSSSGNSSTSTGTQTGSGSGSYSDAPFGVSDGYGGYYSNGTYYYGVAPTGVTIDETTIYLRVGDSYNLDATVKPSNAEDKSLTWSSSRTAIATVSAYGKVKAKDTGTATITVTTVNGYKDTCKIKVVEDDDEILATKVVIDDMGDSEQMSVGDIWYLDATIYPSTVDDDDLTWSSSSTTVATIGSSTGKLTAKKAGTTTIKVKTSNGCTDSFKLTVVK